MTMKQEAGKQQLDSLPCGQPLFVRKISIYISLQVCGNQSYGKDEWVYRDTLGGKYWVF